MTGALLLDRVAGEGEDGVRADVALRAWLGEPRTRTHQRLAAGEVCVDGQPVDKARRLRAGERVTVAAPSPGPPVPEAGARSLPPLPVRYEDAHLAVVAKPAGLVVHAGAGVADRTLVDALRAQGLPLAPAGGAERPGIVHRLDRGTSGLLVVAKTDAAHRGLAAALKARRVSRAYTAIVDGVPEQPRATVDAPIGRSPRQRTRFAVEDGGRPAVTHYDVVEAHGRGALLDVRLETGRTHQIRVHLSALGHPVAGDLAYGASPVLARELGLERPALHAGRLALTHPVTGARVEVEEPLPPDLAAAADRLRGLGR